LTVTIDGKTTTFTVTVSAATLQSIVITSLPTKTEYTKGESLNLSELVITGTYSDGTTKAETVSLSNISGYNADTTGQQSLTVTIGGKTATFTVTVNEAALQSIAITSPPTKTVYTQGESLDLSGLAVIGNYSNGSYKTETVSRSDISGYNANTIGQQTLTITLGGQTATFVVTVNPATLQSIVVISPPTKTVYTKGESLNLNGLMVTGTYSDGSAKAETVILSNIRGYNSNSVGTQTLTINISGKTATFTVKVQATASFTVIFDDPINGTPENIVLSKTGAQSSIVLEIAGTYETYKWRINDKEEPVSVSASYTLNAADCPLGRNFLDVQVKTSSGAYYSKEITFIVNK
jgi:hypothetical protein